MKKILFLLLLSVTMYGQVPADATPLENIQITNNIQDNVSTKVAVQTNDGVINWKYIADIDVKTKARLSTGLLKNGLISSSPDDTKFNITAGIGIISNFDDPENPISTLINFPAFNFITPAYLNTGNITYVAINSTPAVVMQATPFTPIQRRSLILLGAVIHSNLTTINVLNNISAPTNADTNQLHDFMEAVGALNITGNKYIANGANLQLNKSAGVLFKLGSNFAVDWKNPHEISQTGGTAITFRYRTQNGTESADMTSISPGLYDLNNVLTTVPNNKFTIQTVTVFQTGLTRIQWGQTIYDDLQSAKNALLTRDFVVENNIKENGVTRAYVIVRNSTTSLQNVSDAYISEAQKFGGVASGGVALTLANIVTALGYTPENEANKQNTLAVDGTGIKYPTVDATNAGLALKQNTLTNPITGTGTTNTFPIFTGTTTQGNSILTQTATTSVNVNGNIVAGTASPTANVRAFFESSQINLPTLELKNPAVSASFGYAGLRFTSNNGVTQFGKLNSSSTGYKPFKGGDTFLLNSGPGNISIFNDRVGFGNINFTVNAMSTPAMTLEYTGNLLVNKITDNGIDKGQFEGTISFSAGTTANQGVIKSQLDLKADIASPTFTGVPNVPTATVGTNTTQIASTAFVNGAFGSGLYGLSITRIDATDLFLRVINNSSTTAVLEQNNTAAIFRQASNNSTGVFNRLLNEGAGTGNYNRNTANGIFNDNYNPAGGIFNNNINSGTATFNYNVNNTGIFNESYNTGTGIFDKRKNESTGILNQYDSQTASTGDLQQYLKNGVLTAKINHLGELTAPKITMTGTIKMAEYTVATLPTPTGTAYATVTDALAPSYLGTLTGGGTVKAPVFYDGTVWRSTINSDSVSLAGNQTIGGIKTFTGPLIVSNLGGGPSRIVSADVNGELSASSVFTHDGQIAVTNSVTANSFIKTSGTASQFLKADGSVDESDVVRNIVKEATQGANVTGTVSETILYSKLIPANTFKDGDFMTLFSRVGKIGVAGTLGQRVKINTSNTLTGATTIAFNFGIETNRIFSIHRTFTIQGGFLTGLLGSVSASSDIINNTNIPQNYTFDPTIDNYIFITGTLSNSADIIYNLGTKITN